MERTIIDITELPPEAQRSILDYYEYLRDKIKDEMEEKREKRRKAFDGFLNEFRNNPIHVDPDLDIHELIKEMYDVDL